MNPEMPFLKSVERGQFLQPGYGIEVAKFEVQTAEWTHLRSCRFGEPRPCGFMARTNWTGDSYRYDIFQRDLQYAMRWSNGSGDGWLVSADRKRRGERNLLAMIAAMPSEEERWDACHFIYETFAHTTAAVSKTTAQKYSQAFVEKRLKKRRRNKQTIVEIVEP